MGLAKARGEVKPFAALAGDPLGDLLHPADDFAEWKATAARLAAPNETALAEAYERHAERAADALSMWRIKLRAIADTHNTGVDKSAVAQAASGILAERRRNSH